MYSADDVDQRALAQRHPNLQVPLHTLTCKHNFLPSEIPMSERAVVVSGGRRVVTSPDAPAGSEPKHQLPAYDDP